jgi:hypothetical protein
MTSLILFVALGGTIHNADAHEYRVHIKTAKAETSRLVNATYTVEKACDEYPCTLRLMYTDDRIVLHDPDENVEIKDGVFKSSEEGGGGGGSAPAAAPAPAPKPSGKKRK